MKSKIIAITLLATLSTSIGVFAVQNVSKNAKGGTYHKYEQSAPAYMGTINTDTATKHVPRDYATFRYWKGPSINISARDANSNNQVSGNVSVYSDQKIYHSRYYSNNPPNRVYMKFNTRSSASSAQRMNLSWSPDDPS